MTEPRSMFERLKARGEEVFNRVAAELMANPTFVKALQGAMKGKEKVDKAVGRVLKQMNIPTRSEFKRAVDRIEALEREIEALRGKAKARSKPRRRKPAARAKPKAAPKASASAVEPAPAEETPLPELGLEEPKDE